MKTVSAKFPGANYPPGTKVSFVTKQGVKHEGVVEGLLMYQARVVVHSKLIYKVPYHLLKPVDPNSVKPMVLTLAEIEARARKLFNQHNIADWNFAFSLTTRQAGCCWYNRKLITISVTYCQTATLSQIVNTLLHEIAHALAGYINGHNHIWKRIAKQIGCTAERCHAVQHAPSKWTGKCRCGSIWHRQRLTKAARYGHCSKCQSTIEWQRAAEILNKAV